MALVKFYSCTQTQYDALTWDGGSATGISSALYFTSDTKRLYKGETLYGGSFEYVSTRPTIGNTETLYFEETTGKILTYEGKAWVEKFLPFEGTLSQATDKVPTSKAVYDAIDAEATTRSGADTYLSGQIDIIKGNDTTTGSFAKAIKDAVEALDATEVGGTDKVITTISEADGVISATAIDLTTAAVKRTATTNVAGTTAEAAIVELGDEIAKIEGDDTTTGSIAKAVKDAQTTLQGNIDTEATQRAADDQVLSGAIDAEKTAREADTAFLSGAIGEGYSSANTVKAAIEAISAAAISVSGAADGAIEVTSSGAGNVNKTVALKINANDKFLSQTSDGLSAQFTLVKKVSGDTGFNDTTGNIAAEYYIADKNGTQVGDRISIAKDQFLQSASFVQGSGSGDDKLQLTFNRADGSQDVVDIPLSGLFDEYTAGAGIAVTPTATGIEISGVVDQNSEFLTVGPNGFKVDGVTTAINTAKDALSSAIGTDATSGEFDENNTVVDYIKSKIQTLQSTTTAALANKLDDVDENKAGEIIIATAEGKVATSGKEIGGATFDATPDADTLATEAGVSAFVNDALTGSLVWNTLP